MLPSCDSRFSLGRYCAVSALALVCISVWGEKSPAQSSASETKYVCPPCGCASDGKVFDAPGTCPHCGMGLVRKMPQRPARKVAILVYEGMELLDFAGPAEVFAVTLGSDGAAFEVYTVGAGKEPVVSQQFLKITPQYSIADGPKPDIVVIPGGAYPALGRNERMMNWIKERARDIEILMSVCNGALVLARAGLLDGLEVTTHAGSIERLRGAVPGARVVTNRRFVDSGRIITAAGVSAGIDAALHVVERLLGPEAAANTARYMEYDLRPDRSFGAAGTAAPGKE